MKNIFKRIRSFLNNRKALRALAIQDAIFTVLDTETTGLSVNEGHKIVSVGAIKIKNYQLIENETLDELINPEREIPLDRKSTRLNSSHVSESRMPSSA